MQPDGGISSPAFGRLRWAACLVLALTLTACGDGNDKNAGWSVFATEVVREVIAEGEPASAPGQRLELTSVIIPGGMEIAPHTHPGLQLALIVQGTLTYTVIDGEAQITYDAGTEAARSETVRAGETVSLTPGTAVLETPGMVHRAHNEGSLGVLIYLSSLFPLGAPASSPAD